MVVLQKLVIHDLIYDLFVVLKIQRLVYLLEALLAVGGLALHFVSRKLARLLLLALFGVVVKISMCLIHFACASLEAALRVEIVSILEFFGDGIVGLKRLSRLRLLISVV